MWILPMAVGYSDLICRDYTLREEYKSMRVHEQKSAKTADAALAHQVLGASDVPSVQAAPLRRASLLDSMCAACADTSTIVRLIYSASSADGWYNFRKYIFSPIP